MNPSEASVNNGPHGPVSAGQLIDTADEILAERKKHISGMRQKSDVVYRRFLRPANNE
jgi:hypothetical protein